jgi:protein phosphatase
MMSRQDPGHGAWAAGGSDIGSVRADNEDAWLCDTERGLFIIADGMGGHAAGEEASAAAVRLFNDALSTPRLHTALVAGEDAVRALFHDAFNAANKAIVQLGKAYPDWAGMGTTAVLAYLADDLLYVANAGDTRAYLVRDDHPAILTRDHTVAALMVENETLTVEEMREHPLRNRLTLVLGDDDGEIDPAFSVHQVRPGDRIVLCTDGLWNMIEDDEMVQIVNFSASAHEAVYSLIAAADDAGGRDNISVIVLFR